MGTLCTHKDMLIHDRDKNYGGLCGSFQFVYGV